jgi:hypothetical protein
MNIKAFLLAGLLATIALPAVSAAQGYGSGQGYGQSRGYGAPRGYAQRGQNDDGNDSLGSAWDPRPDRIREGVLHGGNLPLAAVVRLISRRMPGRVLDIGLEGRGGRPIYRVRWLTEDGRRLDLLVDAATGVIVGQ